LALTLLPAFLQLHRIVVTNPIGEQLWTIDASNAAELQEGGLRTVVADDRESLLILDTPAGSHVTLRLPDSVQTQLMSGGAFTLEMSGLDPHTFTSRLVSAQELRLTEREHHAGNSFTSRILQRFIRQKAGI
jgi:hypothetical protein